MHANDAASAAVRAIGRIADAGSACGRQELECPRLAILISALTAAMRTSWPISRAVVSRQASHVYHAELTPAGFGCT
jgi:hypothetical protein